MTMRWTRVLIVALALLATAISVPGAMIEALADRPQSKLP